MVRLGSIVSGIVEQVTPHAVVVRVNAECYTRGTIIPEHLADHQGIHFICLLNFEELLFVTFSSGY